MRIQLNEYILQLFPGPYCIHITLNSVIYQNSMYSCLMAKIYYCTKKYKVNLGKDSWCKMQVDQVQVSRNPLPLPSCATGCDHVGEALSTRKAQKGRGTWTLLAYYMSKLQNHRNEQMLRTDSTLYINSADVASYCYYLGTVLY